MIFKNFNDNWRLHEAPLNWDATSLGRVSSFEDGWLKCSIPADVRIPLIENGIIRDPVLADYFLESEWIEQRSWWFFREFDVEASDLSCDVLEIVLEAIDAHSDIFINGQHIGKHINVHRAFVYNVKKLVKIGKNELAVRVTTGLETVTDEQLSQLNWAICHEQDNDGFHRGDYRRAFVRRPQYTIGWDWGPKVVTCGITGAVYLRGYCKIAIREVSVSTVTTEAVLRVMANVENLNMISTACGDVCVEVLYEGVSCAEAEQKDVLLTSGANYFDFDICVKNPKLWWPNGYGEQPLYTIRVSVICGDVKAEYSDIEYGIRTVKLDTSAIEGEHRNFAIIVNGVRVFCKGGDWIPSDSIYARITKEKYNTLINEAVAANFNILRIWGGGLYERDVFYSLCNKAGVMIWQDFMFACSTYPDHIPWFKQEVAGELDYQTKRLRNHPCIAVLCGSNENHWIFNEVDNPKWGIEITPEYPHGMHIYNTMAKEAVRKNCSFIPYWNSSPYGGKLPNDFTSGSVHRWPQGFMNPDMEVRIDPKKYDSPESKFVAEYGYVGPCCLETMKEYMDDQPMERGNRVWELHNNTFEKETVYAGIRKHYLDKPEDLSFDDYILYGGMVQGMMLGYSLEAYRFHEHCAGGIFWMYNDTWGEIGWTIIDYYLRRKISFYGVKRAFAPVKFSMRVVDGNLKVQGCNDTEQPVTVIGLFGYRSFDNKTDKCKPVSFTLEPRSRVYVHNELLPDEDYLNGSIVFIPENSSVNSVMLRMFETRDLAFGGADVEVLEDTQCEGGRKLTLSSKAYAHGVYIKNGAYHCSDNYFDLLPGEVKTITVDCPAGVKLEICTVK